MAAHLAHAEQALRSSLSHASASLDRYPILTTSTDRPLLTVSDHLTHPSTLSFYQRYFGGEVPRVEEFTEAVMQEYMVRVVRPQVERLVEEDGEYGEGVDIEGLVEEVKKEIGRKVSIDSRRISLNALELLTREHGLEKSLVVDTVNECFQREKAKKSVKLNNDIMQELMEVQSMLEKKNRALA